MKRVMFCAMACCCASFAASDASHPNFTGNWRLESEKSELHSKGSTVDWDIQQTDGDISISEQSEGRTEQVKCETNGSNCKAKENGEPAEVSFYYNGALLVEMEMMGHSKDHVIKKRLKLAQDGKTMEVEVLHINPTAPAEKLVFEKQ